MCEEKPESSQLKAWLEMKCTCSGGGFAGAPFHRGLLAEIRVREQSQRKAITAPANAAEMSSHWLRRMDAVWPAKLLYKNTHRGVVSQEFFTTKVKIASVVVKVHPDIGRYENHVGIGFVSHLPGRRTIPPEVRE